MASQDPAPATEGLVPAGDVRLQYWDTGGDGDVVVLCHPASQGTAIWRHQRRAFASHGYRVIAYARRGHDASEKGTSGDPGTTVGDLTAFLDTLGITKAHILGAAAGGITALAFAVAHPQRVRSLTLAGTIFSLDEDTWRDAYARLEMEGKRGLVSEAFLELGPSYRLSNPQGTAHFARLSEAALANGPARQPSGVSATWQLLEQLRVPTLLATGEADLYAPPPLQAMVAERLPDGEVTTFREVGHAAYWEVPELFNATVLAFLDRHRGRD